MNRASVPAKTVRQAVRMQGKRVTLRHRSGSAYNVDTGGVTASQEDEDTTAILLDYADSSIDNTSIARSDRQATFDAGLIEAAPAAGDQVIDGDDVYIIQNVNRFDVAGTTVAYRCQVRR